MRLYLTAFDFGRIDQIPSNTLIGPELTNITSPSVSHVQNVSEEGRILTQQNGIGSETSALCTINSIRFYEKLS